MALFFPSYLRSLCLPRRLDHYPHGEKAEVVVMTYSGRDMYGMLRVCGAYRVPASATSRPEHRPHEGSGEPAVAIHFKEEEAWR